MLVRRLAGLIPVWLLVSLFTFLLLHLTPGDPASVMLGPDASQEAIRELRERMGLERPLPQQFAIWIGGVLRGDFGESIFLAAPVTELILERLPVTASLALSSMAVAVAVGIPFGVWAALRPNGLRDILLMVLSFVGVSIPEFVLGLFFLLFFGVELGWLPVGGYVPIVISLPEWARHMILPSLTLGTINAALVARMTRAAMLEVLSQDYIRTARAKGVATKVIIWKHAFRNVSLNVTTVIGVTVVVLMGGAFITEQVFNLPGVGMLTIGAVQRRDYPVVQGVMLAVATLVMVVNALVDALYSYLDPRVRV